MKKTLISVFAITSLVVVNLIALKFRLKPPKKEVFYFDEPIKEEKQDVLYENKKLKYDTQNKIENIPQKLRLISGSGLFREAYLQARKNKDVERYIMIFHLLLNDIKSLNDDDLWSRSEAISLFIDELINGLDFFEEDKRIVCFLYENKVALENIGIFYEPKPKFS
ncbi:hypothetical protein PEG85_13135 [Lactococcus cremoris]|uniref:hypothetical protein n=1 Tax=Lactococcus lactis subsp. cremoris TaxID=1359 RepID=UPI0022E3CA38|nr:hypothetical protein [Lactococcus cremoris]MDA2881902.1 hypothetical protein [Lactococcus cremoris]MDA2884375.1 hypothetical protein [Lactococcus cremoris]